MGLPLALKVLGSYLRGKSTEEWGDAMRRLESIPFPGIQKVLQLSYESLEEEQDKDIFLHVACFFVGDNKDYIVKLLAECNLYPIIGIKNLIYRCLVYVEDGKVGMHQLIREMGQEVVRQESPKYPGKRTRLWHHEDCINVLREDEGTEKVEGLMLDMQRIKESKTNLATKMDRYSRKRSFEEYQGKTIYENEANFEIGALEKMKNLMLLQLNYVTFSGECDSLPKKLRLLRWHGFPLISITGNCPLKKLVVLDMSYSKLECVWEGIKFIRSLKVLNLSYCDDLMKTPNFKGLPGLESLILKGCKRLIKVDESIGCLNELVLLDLTNCINLREFPYFPASLVSVAMSGCPNLGVVGGFRCLEVTSLPSLLRKLNISNCNLYDHSFPDDWSNLVSLEDLYINGNNVTSLPKCIQSLPKLAYIEANHCSHIRSIIGLPRTAHDLICYGNESLEKIQGTQNYYERINVQDCPKLWDVGGFNKYQSIDKVDKKIIVNLGLVSSNECEEMELGTLNYSTQKVLYECGIFSTSVIGNQIPCCSSYMYREKGPKISFKVPENDSRLITSFNTCLVFSQLEMNTMLEIQVYNKTKDLLWNYQFQINDRIGKKEKKGWVSLWRCGNLLDHGDEIFIRIIHGSKVCVEVEECGINLVYHEDNQNFEECDEDELARKEGNSQVEVSAFDGIAWSDRMLEEISDCVHNGMTYSFGYYRSREGIGLYAGQVSHAMKRLEDALVGWIL